MNNFPNSFLLPFAITLSLSACAGFEDQLTLNCSEGACESIGSRTLLLEPTRDGTQRYLNKEISDSGSMNIKVEITEVDENLLNVRSQDLRLLIVNDNATTVSTIEPAGFSPSRAFGFRIYQRHRAEDPFVEVPADPNDPQVFWTEATIAKQDPADCVDETRCGLIRFSGEAMKINGDPQFSLGSQDITSFAEVTTSSLRPLLSDVEVRVLVTPIWTRFTWQSEEYNLPVHASGVQDASKYNL